MEVYCLVGSCLVVFIKHENNVFHIQKTYMINDMPERYMSQYMGYGFSMMIHCNSYFFNIVK